jgi:uncharacterized protein
MGIRSLVFSANLKALEEVLQEDPRLASIEIPLPDNPATAHPFHRICDGVFGGYYPESTGLELAKVFLKSGASLNPHSTPGKDSPLTTACGLRCDKLALFYIDQGADINHQGFHGGTALHWSAWCGRDVILRRLLEFKPEINRLCFEFKSTPLLWAVHGFKFGGKDNQHHQLDCAKILLEHGADPTIPNLEGYLPQQLLDENDLEFAKVFAKVK